MNDEEQPWWHEEGAPPGGGGSTGPAASTGDVLGTAAEEAVKLLSALRDRMAEAPPPSALPWADVMSALGSLAGGLSGAPRAASGSPTAAPAEPVQPGQAAACSYCPVCQAIAVVRAVQPETVERLTGAVLELADAVREAADSRFSGGAAGSRLHHIDLDDDDAAATSPSAPAQE